MIYLLAALVTFVAKSIMVITGAGAAFILIPAFYAMGFDLHQSMSTALLLNVVAMAFASYSYSRIGLIKYKLAFPIIIAVLITSPIGAYCSKFVPRETLLLLFALFLIFAASMMIFYKQKKSNSSENFQINKKQMLTIATPIGAFAGFVAGLLGIGGGNMIIPILIFIGVPARFAAATTSFIVLFSSFGGFLGKLAIGGLDIKLLFSTIIAAIMGALFGSYLMKYKLSNKSVKVLIGVVLYMVAAKMLFDYFVH
ncbi:hypothetical protein TDSAC_0382 [Thermodesulfobium acidiphilum]|uniref:Probable membrane transporter protein n=1 Tax=Thermodesulfobium acidiphilum TaxID=1794699 RepID=A0A2R4VZ75_THEAF|nr:sulfite exporter TauE/SafE family protein [Thermodesulfobium acidiphilum]AWB09758.1 hypothetical protein TDSAC_0382 [Thermodesulfobium acidiphilum]